MEVFEQSELEVGEMTMTVIILVHIYNSVCRYRYQRVNWNKKSHVFVEDLSGVSCGSVVRRASNVSILMRVWNCEES